MLELRSQAAADLPEVGSRRLAVRLTVDALTHVRRGSPWVFEGSVESVSLNGEEQPGDLAVIFDARREFAAIGLWDPASAIRIKMLHAGTPQQIDAEFWSQRVGAALDRRATLREDPDTDAYRLIHGENDGFPGLVVDRYANTLVVKIYSAIWWPHLRDVLEPVVAAESPARVVLRLARSVVAPSEHLADGSTLFGEPNTAPVIIRERGLQLEADVVAGNKTGHFLDQRDNRSLVRASVGAYPKGAEVLDVFSHTGGFALSAAAGGARKVHMVDASAPALEAATRNFTLNRHIHAVRECQVRTTVGDAFEVLAQLRADDYSFDVVILDPPSFAHSERNVAKAEQAYFRLTQAGLRLLRPGGLLVQASCSSRIDDESFYRIVHEAAVHARRDLQEIRRTGHPIDHPVGFEYGAYLKAVFARARN
jgi:23S rRNA (cytosine1962-C5)-methyltransferase